METIPRFTIYLCRAGNWQTRGIEMDSSLLNTFSSIINEVLEIYREALMRLSACSALCNRSLLAGQRLDLLILRPQAQNTDSK